MGSMAKTRTFPALAGVLVGLALLATPSPTHADPANAMAQNHVSIVPSQTPAFPGDAPDPDIVYSGGTYYGFTTGTALGNNLQALIDTTGNPATGWRSYTGQSFGSTALPVAPSWETANTQTSPGVFSYGGHWVMFYDASVSPNPADSGHSCLSVATAPALTPASPVFTDASSGPLFCAAGGVLDPSPFIDPATGGAYLLWKSNDGSSAQPSQVWSVRLSPDGTSFVGTPGVLLTVDQADLPWETTFDDPQMVFSGGVYDLLFSTGDFLSASYAQALTTCNGPVGPCSQPSSGPFLGSYGNVAGPGGGSLFADPSGQWWLGYAGWLSPCTNYSCGGVRRMFVAPITLGNSVNVPCKPPGNPAGYRMAASDGGVFTFGNLPFCGSTGSISINRPVVGIADTIDGGGYWLVASDGGIFAFGDASFFGDAGFFGSTGAIHLNQPIVGMAGTPDGKGYWLVASDGGIFAFGDAGFFGSTGAIHLNRPIVGMGGA